MRGFSKLHFFQNLVQHHSLSVQKIVAVLFLNKALCATITTFEQEKSHYVNELCLVTEANQVFVMRQSGNQYSTVVRLLVVTHTLAQISRSTSQVSVCFPQNDVARKKSVRLQSDKIRKQLQLSKHVTLQPHTCLHIIYCTIFPF